MAHFLHVQRPVETSWQALSYYNLYRFLIAVLFVSLDWIGQLPQPLGAYDESLFSSTAHIYLLTAPVAQLFIRMKKPSYVYQVAALLFADILLITLLMYASAGLNSGFGMLLVAAVAGGGLLSPGRIGILFAAVATIAVLSHEVYAQLYRIFPPANYTHAGFLGITFFLTAFVMYILASRVEESKALAAQRGTDLENLARLNEHIVQRLQPGILVLDSAREVRLVNESAKDLLEMVRDPRGVSIDHVSQPVAGAVTNWLAGNGPQTINLAPGKGGTEVQATFSKLNLGKKTEVLIFLDDVSEFRRRAQQMKLASLGRLTASIAHEIRNPLGAISHASQLLTESKDMRGEDRRLISIIQEQSTRVNNIIENIQQLSRRQQPVETVIDLAESISRFTDELRSRLRLEGRAITLKLPRKRILARIEPSQLHQVLWNLCENGIRYSHGERKIDLECGMREDSQRPYIDVTDYGTGISPEAEENLFEPFYTTDVNGTGLGLYIAREICEANQASLILFRNTRKGCCFRINFAHPERQRGSLI